MKSNGGNFLQIRSLLFELISMIRTSNNEIESFLRQFHIDKGDMVMIHADLRMFGLLENNGNDFLKILKASVGDSGTLITPSFTFSFPSEFDLRNTRSTTGAIGNLFRRDLSVYRVPDGMTSYYILGEKAEELISNWSNSSYGIGSIPDQFVKLGGKVLQLGTEILSLVHLLEEYVIVPYRENKRFEGTIRDGEKIFNSYTDFYVRSVDVKKLIPDPIRKDFYEQKCENIIMNNYTSRIFSGKDYIDYGFPRLNKNKWILVEKENK